MPTFIQDIDLAIDELRSIKTLAQRTMADLSEMRTHQEHAFELGCRDQSDVAMGVVQRQHILAENRLEAAREKMKHFTGCLLAVEHHMQPALAPTVRTSEVVAE